MTPRRPRTAFASSVLLAVLALASGCGAAPPAMAPADASGSSPPPSPATPMPMPAPGVTKEAMGAPNDEPAPTTPASAPRSVGAPGNAGPAPGGKPASASESTAEAPLIVYEGELTLRVESGMGPGAVDSIVTLAESLGGHLAGRDEGRVVVKIPSRRFREAMSNIDGAFEVERRNVKAEDVTAEFKDLEVRLENLRATRKRIEELLQKSGTLADTLSVERELERVAAEIDRIQGRLRFLRTHTSFSTLTATVVEKPKAPQIVASKTPPATKRDLALPLGWLDRLGVDTLTTLPAED